ncbi:DUF4932 domain-containing protein [Lacinutrix chionoecetis]
MKPKVFLLLIFIITFLSCKQEKETTKKQEVSIIKASINMASLREGNIYRENSWTISPDLNPDVWTIEVSENDTTKATFITDQDSITFNVKLNDIYNFIVVLNEKDSAYTQIQARPKAASFTKKYIAKNKGKYTVDNPEVHEMVNIMVALTKIGELDSNMVEMKTKYYKDVMRHFKPYRNHPVIDSLNNHITKVFDNDSYMYYYNIRMNANMYSFDQENKVVNNSPYNRLGFDPDNYLEPLLPLVNDFAEKTNYREFYKEHKKYHNGLIKEYYRLANINKMWEWIENKFPQRYEGYKIFFSPLVGGAHSTQRFSNEDYKETVMFINAPTFSKDYSDKEKEAILTRIVFTEIDHNYVNPTTDTFPEINNIMTPLDCWNSGAQGYGVPYATFNEYMTWAIFSLYLYDNFDANIFEKRNKAEADFMQNGRGFIKFEAFNDFVLDWYKNNPKKQLNLLYPEAIEWIKKQDCSK